MEARVALMPTRGPFLIRLISLLLYPEDKSRQMSSQLAVHLQEGIEIPLRVAVDMYRWPPER